LVQKKVLTAKSHGKEAKLSSDEDEESIENTQIMTEKDVHRTKKPQTKKSQSKIVKAIKLNQKG
jgi:hypothetical protein